MTDTIISLLEISVFEDLVDLPNSDDALHISEVSPAEIMIEICLNERSVYTFLTAAQAEDLVKKLSAWLAKPPAVNAWASLTKR